MFDVRKISKLARLNLTENEEKSFAGELETILQYVTTLNAVNTDSIDCFELNTGEPTLREDEPVESGDPEKRLAVAPKIIQNQFLVPRVIGEGDA
ncbi:MAG: Asp-tRNA(Asn)/Glu-tRNA(Gln) amidotransferase subunit GatC [Candidatus Riflebacteria bacterium]|nr:Asp-tRNA(Asn)/Glu-tRNA(Gln) amidotransferase subunit GatC [Candidatus Riflebacteria bacterium]